MDILDIAIAKQLAGGGGGSGTDNYNDLSNLPKINDVTLSGNKSSSALGLQSEITSENKLDSDLIDDTNQDNKFVTSSEKNTWNAKQNAIDADHKLNADYVDDSTSTNKFVTASDKEAWNAKQNAIDNSHKLSSDLVDDANHTNKFVTSTEKSTWNGKQNAIDSEHKLSSSLVSFTTAEVAALASGIDSTKVAQISTNQSNILYTLGKTGKNIFDFDAWIDGLTVTNGSLTKSGNAITITATGNDAYTDRFDGNRADAYRIATKPGESIVIQWDADLTQASNGGFVYVFPNGNNAGMSYTSASTKKIIFAVPSGCYFVTVRFGVSNNGETIVYSNIMICTQEDWNVSPDYQPYSGLSNLALTESENKNAIYNLSTGVKNLFNFDAWKDVEIERGTKTVGANSITITATSADAYTKYGANYPETVKIYVQTGDVICLSWDYTPNNNQANDKAYIFSFGSNPTTPVSNSNTYSQTEYLTYTVPANVQYVEIRFGVTTNGYSATYSNIMVCTKAAWDQEPNVFRPFALPNYDLTYLEAEDRAALAEVVDSGAKNLSSWNDGSLSTAGFIIRDYPITLTPGNYVLAYRTTATGGNTELTLNSVAVVTLPNSSVNRRVGFFTVDTTKTNFSLYSDGTNNTITDFMICTLADWKVSQSFVPYRPSYDLLADSIWSSEKLSFGTTAADTWEYSGLSFTVPAGSSYELIATDLSSYTTPKGILIAKVNTNLTSGSNIVAISPTLSEGGYWSVSASAATPLMSSNETYYVWVKHSAATVQNAITLFKRKIV